MGAAKVLHGAERNLPANLAIGHIHRGEGAPGRREARQVGRGLQKAANHSVGRSSLRPIFAILLIESDFIARDELHLVGKVVGIHDQQTVLGIESIPAPSDAAQISGYLQRALDAGWSKYALVTKASNFHAAKFAI